MLIAGERRLLAARQAGLDRVPVLIREATDQQRLELALIENVQRADLNPLEAAEAYRQLAEDFGLSHEEIAERVGKSRVTVTNTLRLLKLPESVQPRCWKGASAKATPALCWRWPTPAGAGCRPADHPGAGAERAPDRRTGAPAERRAPATESQAGACARGRGPARKPGEPAGHPGKPEAPPQRGDDHDPLFLR